MGKTWLCTVLVATLALIDPRETGAQSAAASKSLQQAGAPALRVRSENREITALVARASEGSTSFRRSLTEIDGTDGVVYVENGECRHGRPACMAINVVVAGPNRILRIVVDPRRAGCDRDLMASIGHELWHVLEVLREPSLRSFNDVFQFYNRGRFGFSGAFETFAAIKAGDAVFNELGDAPAEKTRACARHYGLH